MDSSHARVSGRLLGGIVFVSLLFHGISLLLSQSVLAGWGWANEPVHTALEISGSLIALWAARIMLSHRVLGLGTSFNTFIAAAMVGMGILDGLHALVHVGQQFVLLHSLATFVGGLLFAAVWLGEGAERRMPTWWPGLAGLGALLFGGVIVASPDLFPPMVVDGEFTTLAVFFNIFGGVLLLLASLKLALIYASHRQLDDGLFALHCLLFGLAATMFHQSRLWDFAWWSWHVLRFLAYCTALWFLLRAQGSIEQLLREQAVARRVGPLLDQLNYTLESIQVGSWEYDLHHQTLSWDEQMHRLHGVPSEAAVTIESWMKCIHADGHARLLGKLEQLTGKGGVLEDISRVVLPDGEIRSVCLRARRQLGEDGHPVKLMGLGWDVTAEQEARATVEAALRARSAFLANMSHEIRTPMNGILGAAELLMRTGSPERKDDYARMIQRSGSALMVIINDILDLSKIESGTLTLENLRLDYRQLVFDAVALFQEQARRKKIHLSVVYPDHEPSWIRGDPTRLQQILLNLLSNAVKFTDRGAVTVMVESAMADDVVELRTEVHDTGIGMAPEKARQIFGRFIQADSSTTRKYGGTGLGTSISRELAEKMGGSLSVSSAEGVGSTFTLVLPVQLTEAAVAVDEASLARSYGERVLLVEDHRVNQVIARRALELLGLEVDLCANGREALEVALAGEYAAILMDIHMPVMDGLEATRRLRAAGCAIPIIAMTANVMVEDIARYQALGMADCIPKPFTIPQLVGILDRVLLERAREAG